jgi:UDP-glucose:(heptosyl)LPS alpha-1,3-glucosyltransferase
MKFAFCLYKYFPFGGQQKNFQKIAKVCLDRGHQVDVFTSSWQGEIPEGFQVLILPIRGLTNHRRRESLAEQLDCSVADKHYDAIIGFNKMPGLDVYYAADTCYAAKADEKSFLYRTTKRYRSYLRMEKAVFGRSSRTEILLLSEKEKAIFIHYYGTPDNRFHLLPPDISKDYLEHSNFKKIREELRLELNIGQETNIILLVGSSFKTKGVDRAINAIAALPKFLREKTILLIAGQDNPRFFRWLAWRRGVTNRVRFVGGRDDIHRFFMAADFLLHPARRENTGTVLIEAMAVGLPVLATDVCGFSYHLEYADAGEIIPSPFIQKTLNQRLAHMLTSNKKEQWRHNGMAYVVKTDLFSRAEKAAEVIEKVAAVKHKKRKPSA